ncbi:MAG: hypothetical protein R2845_11025 [Thermomicrobiales bacterium]
MSNQLCLSENTPYAPRLTPFRRKLRSRWAASSANVLLWSISAGIVDLDSVMPQPVPDA